MLPRVVGVMRGEASGFEVGRAFGLSEVRRSSVRRRVSRSLSFEESSSATASPLGVGCAAKEAEGGGGCLDAGVRCVAPNGTYAPVRFVPPTE